MTKKLKPYRRLRAAKSVGRERDWFDRATLGTAIVGIVVAAGSLVASQVNQASSGRDTAHAIAGIENIAKSMAAQQDAMSRQADATAAASQATANTSRAIISQTTAMRDANRLTSKGLSLAATADAALIDEEVGNFSVGQRFKIKVTLINTGHVPLGQVTVAAGSRILPKSVKPDLAVLPSADMLVTRLLAIGGRTGQALTSEVALNQEAYDAVTSGSAYLVVIGRATFRDANGVHHRYSCAEYSGPAAGDAVGCVVGKDD